MRVVVTGATSFIGRAFINISVKKGWEVIPVVRKNSPKISFLKDVFSVDVLELNMNEYSELGEMVGHIDCLVHFAWNGTRGADRMNRDKQEKNYEYSVALVEAVLKSSCKRIITAGSQAEYGVYNGVITEELECKPNTEYGVFKYLLYKKTQELCLKAGVSHKEPRFFSIYGPEDYNKTLIMSMIDKMKNNLPCDLTECVQLWDFLYVKDAVEAVALMCENDCADGAYNLGSGDVRTLKDYVKELYTIIGSESKLHFGAVPYPPTGMVSIFPSIEKIKTQLNWSPEYSFERGIREMLSYER